MNGDSKFQYDVFLSHNAKDKPRLRRLAERLKQAGLRVWFDEWNVGPGDIIALMVDEGLEQSRVLLLCISPNALASGWVALERSTAIHRNPANEGRRFIPLLLADRELPDTLPDMLKLPPISHHSNVNELISKFGGADQLRNAVNQLQSLLYAA